MNNEDIEKITRDWENFQTRMYILGYRKFTKALKQQIEPILASLDATQSAVLVQAMSSTLISPLAIQEAFASFLPMVYDRTAKQVFKTYLKFLPKETGINVGFGSDIFRAGFKEYSETVGIKHIKDITETTLKRVNDAFTDGAANGDTMRQLAKRIETYTLGSNGSGLDGRINVKARALMIARTETGMASANAKELQTLQYPYEFETIWITDHPKEHRNWHVSLNKTKVDFGKTKFKVVSPDGVTYMKYPHDPNGGAINVINCKCSYVNKPKEDKEGNLIKKF